MLLLEAMGVWYQEGGGRHHTGRMAEVRELGTVREDHYHLWLFLAHMGRWESGRIQGSRILDTTGGWLALVVDIFYKRPFDTPSRKDQ